MTDISLSCLRWLIGLTAGTVIGVALGLADCLMGKFFRPVGMTLQFLRALPIFGLLPLVQLTFGISEFGKAILILFAATFPVYFSVQNALTQSLIDRSLFFSGMNMPLSARLSLDLWPRLRRGIVYGVEISIGLSWITVVAAESVGTLNKGFWAGGLGQKLFNAFDVNHVAEGVIALGVFGCLGLVTGYLWSLIKHAYGY